MRNSIDSQYLPIAAVTPSPHAARTHSKTQRRKLKAIIEQFGQVAPIIVDQSNVIVDGHAVYDALRELSFDEVAVVVVHNRSEAEIRALRLALNRIGQDTRWDNAKLKQEFKDLLQLGFELDLTGFDSVEVDMTLRLDAPVGNTVEEMAAADIQPMAGPTVTNPGDIWCLGRHVIGCGDARDADHLRRLMAGYRATVVFTDPPYNVPVDGFVSGRGSVAHREFAMAAGEMNSADFTKFLSQSLAAMKQVVADGAIAFVCMDWRHMGELLQAGQAQALELKNVCAWVKSNHGMGTFYRSQHELVFVFKSGTGPHQNNFELGQYGRSRTNVWRYGGVNAFGRNRMELLGIHPTCKPVDMIADALRDVSRQGDFVFDPFLGSGSTLLAAEETGRVCVGNELDPAYVDVAVRRWQRRTGCDAIHPVLRETFDAIAERVGKDASGSSDRTPGDAASKVVVAEGGLTAQVTSQQVTSQQVTSQQASTPAATDAAAPVVDSVGAAAETPCDDSSAKRSAPDEDVGEEDVGDVDADGHAAPAGGDRGQGDRNEGRHHG